MPEFLQINSLDVTVFLFAGILVLLLLFGFIMYFIFSYRHKQKDLYLLQQQKQQIDKQKYVLESTLKELRATQAQLIQQEKMASFGELTAGIAHEIQNPLNFVNNFSEVSDELLDEMNENLAEGNIEIANDISKNIKQNLEKIILHGKRADAIVKNMLQHSPKSKGVQEPTDINALCNEYLHLVYHSIRNKDKTFVANIRTEFDEDLSAGESGNGKIIVIPQHIGRALFNIFNNAFYAVNAKQKIFEKQQEMNYLPSVSVQTKKVNLSSPDNHSNSHNANDAVEIIISDNGNGIPKQIINKIFQPFFTTKPTGEGTGLGLSMAYDIITKEHNGSINVESTEGEGSSFIIRLPA
ncbi:MAG: two-component sensor histidine kinase [Bacteroidetes bacterium]|nr:two-component sensor histidine kinase [Bacteroidota bacterium]